MVRPLFRHLCILPALLVAASPGATAPPVVTSSEETAARICLQFDQSLDRLLNACRQALEEGGLGQTNEAEILDNLSYIYLDREAFDLAEDYAQRAITLKPDNAGYLSSLAWVYWQQDRYEEARGHFERSIAIFPEANALAGLANILRVIDGDAEAAVELLEASLAIEPDYSWGLRELGWTHVSRDALPEAEARFRTALEVDEWDINAYLGLARVLRRADRREEALATLNLAMTFDGDTDIYLRIERARMLRELERAGAAVKDARAAVELAPQYQWGYIEHARALKSLGKLGAAVDVLQDGVAAGVEGNALFYWLADYLSDDGRYRDALVAIDRAIALRADEAADHELRAFIVLNLDDNHAALQAANEAVRLSPDTSAYAHYYAAIAEVALRQPDRAVERFDMAIETGLPEDLIGDFAAEMIAEGYFLQALKLRSRY